MAGKKTRRKVIWWLVLLGALASMIAFVVADQLIVTVWDTVEDFLTGNPPASTQVAPTGKAPR